MIITEGECRLFTFKEGALSALGHDLALRASRWSVDLRRESRTVTARVVAASVEVVCARHQGADDLGALSSGDRAKIERTARSEVLRVERFPEVVFEGAWTGEEPSAVDGSLTLCGVTKPIRVAVSRVGERVVCKATVHQPSWGITPYHAMLGALRVQPDVLVEWSLAGV
jgi:polyisoprenoid-binding protein YceI